MINPVGRPWRLGLLWLELLLHEASCKVLVGESLRAIPVQGRIRVATVRALCYASTSAIEDGVKVSPFVERWIGAGVFRLCMLKGGRQACWQELFPSRFHVARFPALLTLGK